MRLNVPRCGAVADGGVRAGEVDVVMPASGAGHASGAGTRTWRRPVRRGVRSPLPLRMLALARAAVVVAAFLACRSDQVLARPPRRGRSNPPSLDGCGGRRSHLGDTPLAPSQQRRGVGG
ncbi:hypothetical protein LX15_005374 [Streptoalloteichus tenebrarius]|uniref:Uncharacterized protein n=1 Tax=Streptoalloteichus tenebrarius (strain ATCC 17920 / DSM 40477 / JCM 4838 / CBS 697.72 / NBRC 16177 / NCIMB 11028 / NRRL B-12390 / A12253. 1 / ISP 5477) TaxID=1933 RepID=A0ABT1I1I2_STRSD|nr:hypothetical protein [Streptoalloteichus tenebrarius]